LDDAATYIHHFDAYHRETINKMRGEFIPENENSQALPATALPASGEIVIIGKNISGLCSKMRIVYR
jgi:hypothetical protein